MRLISTRAGALRVLAIPTLLALAAPAIQASPVAHAAGGTRYVSTTGTDTGDCSVSPCATVSYAVSQAVSGDTIKVAAGTTYSDRIVIPTNFGTLTIVGGNPQVSALTVISLAPGAGISPVLTVNAGNTVLVQGITFTGGTGSHGNNNNDVYGGDVLNRSHLTLLDTTIENGTASNPTGPAWGGGIYSVGTNSTTGAATLLVQFSYVGANPADPTGGNTVTGKPGAGGGIFNDQFSTMAVVCSTVIGNSATGTGADGFGGGILNISSDTTTVIPVVGQPYSTTGNEIINVTIDSNTATGGPLRFGGQGGGIQNFGALTLNDDTVSNNIATGNATSGFGQGGGISNNNGPTVINNSTFAQNQAIATGTGGGVAQGGGIAAQVGLTLNNVTIGDNSATSATGNATGGGLKFAVNATLANTILARNTTTGTVPPPVPGVATASVVSAAALSGDCSGTVTGARDKGGNIADDNTCGFTNADSVNSSTTIGLGTLANNGGSNFTMAIPLTSSAAGIGIATVCEALIGPDGVTTDTDERGLPRHAVTRAAAGNGVQGCDSGAYDTGDNITLPITVIGALAIPGLPGRLGFAASTDPSKFPVGYITFQIGGSTFTVRQPIQVTCPNQCLGTPDVAVPGTATVTLTGVISTAHGAYPVGATVTLTVTILTTLGGPPNFAVTHTVTSIVVAVNGTTIATLLPPYQFGASFIFQPINEPSAP